MISSNWDLVPLGSRPPSRLPIPRMPKSWTLLRVPLWWHSRCWIVVMGFCCSCCFCCRVSFSKLYVTLLALKQAHDRPADRRTDQRVRPVSESWFLLSCFDLFLFFPPLQRIAFVFIHFFFAVLLAVELDLELNLKSRNAHKSFYVVRAKLRRLFSVLPVVALGPSQLGSKMARTRGAQLNWTVKCIFREIILEDNGIINSCVHLLHLFRYFFPSGQWSV